MANAKSRQDRGGKAKGKGAAAIPGWTVAPQGPRETLRLAEAFRVWCGAAAGWRELRDILEGRGPGAEPRDLGAGWCIRYRGQLPFDLPKSGGDLRIKVPFGWEWCLGVNGEPFAGQMFVTQDVKGLESMNALGHLDLSHCPRLTDLKPLSCLINLRSLDLSNCSRLKDLRPLESLKNLSCLNLSSCQALEDLGPLESLKNLTELHLLGSNELSELGPLASLVNLKRLSVAWCWVLGDLSPLATLKNLATLDLHECPKVTDLGPLASLGNLERLDLHGCAGVSDLRPLAALSKLQTLDLSWCERVGNLSPLASSQALRKLDLFRCDALADLSPLGSLQHVQVRPPRGEPSSTDCKDELFRESVGRDVCEVLRDAFFCSTSFQGPSTDELLLRPDPNCSFEMAEDLDRAKDKLCALAGVRDPGDVSISHPWEEHYLGDRPVPDFSWAIELDGREETRKVLWRFTVGVDYDWDGDAALLMELPGLFCNWLPLLEILEGRCGVANPIDQGWEVWSEFPSRAMVAELPISGGTLRIETSERWRWLLLVNGDPVAGETTLSGWGDHELPASLSFLRLIGCEDDGELNLLSSLKNLASLEILYCEELSDISPLESLKNLTYLSFRECPKVTNLDALASLRKVGGVYVDGASVDGASPDPHLFHTKRLQWSTPPSAEESTDAANSEPSEG